jgi:RNA polymerase sigma-70 factor (ECF subfamily)
MDWTNLVEQHSSIVWRTIYRLIPEIPDAADCFQATFLSAWQVSQKQPIRNWSALLRRLATARALERCRELARNRARYDEFPAEGVTDKRLDNPVDNVEAAELLRHLRRALTEIGPREAEVFCLACLEELTYREIASQLGITVNHVGVLLNRARSQLRAKLGSFVPVPAIPAKEKSE